MPSKVAHSMPKMTHAGLAPTHAVTALDEYGQQRELRIAGEFPLTLKVDAREVVTLMTLGTRPEELALGYIRNQRLIESIEEIKAVSVDWDRETVFIETTHGQGIVDWEKKGTLLARPTSWTSPRPTTTRSPSSTSRRRCSSPRRSPRA